MITCGDCLEEWNIYCPLCKNREPTVLKRRILSKKYKKTVLSSLDKKRKHKTGIDFLNSERKYWLQFHPRRVVSLIMRGHDASCRCCYTLTNLTFDHIVPESKGGVNALSNGQILCTECNRIKDDLIIIIEELRLKVEMVSKKKDFYKNKDYV